MRHRHGGPFDSGLSAVALFLALGLPLLVPRPVAAQMATGTYVGNGSAGHAISGLGFKPDVVLIKGNEFDPGFTPTSAVMRTSMMVGDNSKPMVLDNALIGTQIQSLNVDGFTVGSDRRVNQSGIAFYWAAWKADPDMKVGIFTGDGGTQPIIGLGFSPDYLIVMSSAARRAVQACSAAPVGRSFEFDSAALALPGGRKPGECGAGAVLPREDWPQTSTWSGLPSLLKG